MHFLLDCGATVNVLPLAEATHIIPKMTDLRTPKSRLTMFDGTELKTVGMLTATVVHSRSRKRRRMDFYVAATHARAILEMQACTEMDLLSINTKNICAVRVAAAQPSAADRPLTKDFIVESYAELFTGVGLLKGEVHLEVDHQCRPCRCRRLDSR